MKRKGFISVIALMIMALVCVTCTFSLYLVRIQGQIARNSQKSIQSRLVADNMTNRLILDDDNIEEMIIPELYKILRDKKPPYKNKDSDGDGVPDGNKISIPNDSNLGTNIKYANIRLEGSKESFKLKPTILNYDETTSIIIRLQFEYEGINTTVDAKGRIINKIFEIEEPYISEPMMIEHNLVEEFNEFMDLIENEIFDYDPKGSVSVIQLNLEGNGLIDEANIKESLDNSNKSYRHIGKHMLINIKKSSEINPTLEIKHSVSENSTVSLKGNIYCEGDLIISSPFVLEGNLIINKGKLIINTKYKPVISGKVFYRGNEDFNINNVNLKSEKHHIYRYGSYLPGFLDMNIDVIKNK